MTILMYVNDNKLHGFHNIHDQIQAFHDFVDRIVGSLPPANQHWALSNEGIGQFALEFAYHKGDALIHQAVYVGGIT